MLTFFRAVSLSATLCLLTLAVTADQPQSGFVEAVDGIKIHYLAMGEGVPVVLIHGFTGNAEGNWFKNGVAQALAKNHRVIAIDCRGHGKSDKPHDPDLYGMWMWQDVIQVMNALGIEKAHVHGYSMGGYIITQLLAHYPNRFISAAYGGSGIPEVDDMWKAKIPPDVDAVDPKEAEARDVLRTAIPHDWDALNALRENPPWSGAEARLIDLTRITIPVLAMNGEFDKPNAKTHRMARQLPNFKSVVLPGKSHLTAIMADYIPPGYIETLVAFIDANDP